MSENAGKQPDKDQNNHIIVDAPKPEHKGFRGKIADIVHAPWSKVRNTAKQINRKNIVKTYNKARKDVVDYFMEPPRDNDTRGLTAKFRDAGVAVITSPTISFNIANIAYNVSAENTPNVVISSLMTAVSSGMTVLDSWKNRPEASSYKANALYQGVLGLNFIPKLFAGSPDAVWDAAKGITLYGAATTGHWLRSGEEKEAKAAGQTMDEYYQAFSKGPHKYSQSYYGATEFIAVNAGHDPSTVASVIALSGIARALNDKKFWDAKKGPLKHLRQATAPRIFAAGYTVSTVTSALQGDWWFAASQAAWGWGNLNFDLIGPKVKKAIKKKYANNPEEAQKALEGLELIKQQVEQIQQETALMQDHIKNKRYEEAAQEANTLYENAADQPEKQTMYLETIKALAPASRLARQKLKKLGVTWEDTRFENEKENKAKANTNNAEYNTNNNDQNTPPPEELIPSA